MMYAKDKKGYSIVEVLVAVTLLLFAIVGPITIASKGLQSARYAREQNTAFFLAQEGLETIVRFRNNGVLAHYADPSAVDIWDWTQIITDAGCTNSVPCGVNTTFSGGTREDWSLFRCSANSCELGRQVATSGTGQAITVYNYSSDATPSGYTRELYLTVVGNEYVRVRSQVTWPGATIPVEVETYLYNIYGDI